jgi:hypothetical protein
VFWIPKPRIRFACKGAESEQSGFGCGSDPKNPPNPFCSQRGGIGAEQIWVCFFGSQNLKMCVVRRGGIRSRTDLGVFRIPNTPRRHAVRTEGESEQNGFGCVSDPKNPPNPLCSQRGGIGAERILMCFGSQKLPDSVLLVQKWNRSRTDLGVFRIPKTFQIRSARKGGGDRS